MNTTTTTTQRKGPKPIFEICFVNSGVEYFPKWKRIHRSEASAKAEFASINDGLEAAGFPGHNAILYGPGHPFGLDLKAPPFDPEA